MKAEHLAGSTAIPRGKNDFYPTPEWATEALLSKVPLSGFIWEPACGDGAIVRVLRRYGCEVEGSDLQDHGFGDTGVDFLKTEGNYVSAIVTNPPYSLARPFVTHALKYADTTAMLLKLNFLEGQRRRAWLESTPLEWVYVFSRRVSFDRDGEKGRGAGLLAYAWYVWRRGYEGPPKIGWLA